MNIINTIQILTCIIHFYTTFCTRIPGNEALAKSYNMLSGIEIFNQNAPNIISYTYPSSGDFSNDEQQPNEWFSYNKAPSCDYNSQVSEVQYSSSYSLLKEQSKKRNNGYEQTFTVGAEASGVTAETEITNSLMFGNSKTSISGQEMTKQGYSWSFSMDSSARLYSAKMKWDNINEPQYEFNSQLINSIITLNEDASYKQILLFFKDWGTHVLSDMVAGMYCRQTFYSESSTSEDQMYEFNQHVKSNSASYAGYQTNSETSNGETTASSNYKQVSYSVGNTYCRGEVDVSAQMCEGLFASNNEPVVTSYSLYPIWLITQLESFFSSLTISKIEKFIMEIYKLLDECSADKCSQHGQCRLDPNIWRGMWINNWDGNDLNELINNDASCFCEDGYYGNACDLTSNCIGYVGIECFGEEDCCCYAGNQCDDELICNTLNNQCIKSNVETICGGHGMCGVGTVLNPTKPRRGVMVGACGSGKKKDCYDQNKNTYPGCREADGFSGIMCDYANLPTPAALDNTNNGKHGSHGDRIECNKGEVIIGLCGSGKNNDCWFDGNKYFAVIECVSDSKIKITDNCKWQSQYAWGEFLQCDYNQVMVGYCGSGKNRDCMGNAFQIKCCELATPQ